MISGVPFRCPSRPLVLEVCRLQLWWSFGTKAEVVSDEEKPGYAFGWGVWASDSTSVLRVLCVH